MLWGENALKALKTKPYDEITFTVYLIRLIASLLGYKGVRPFRIATLCYFQTPSQYITDVISKGGDPLQDYYDEKSAITERKRLIMQLKDEGVSDYKISLIMNISEYQVKKLKKISIGIGRSLAAPPSHTTQHTGPYYAVRLIPDGGIASRTGRIRSRGTKVQVM